MSQQGVRRFRVKRRWIVVALALLLAGTLVALLLLRPWPLGEGQPSLQAGLDANLEQVNQHRNRIEAGIRLQFLRAAMADGRRSALLRQEYRVLEELLEQVIPLQEPELRVQIETELDALLPDLARNRRSAVERMERLIALLRSPAGPGRQGGDA